MCIKVRERKGRELHRLTSYVASKFLEIMGENEGTNNKLLYCFFNNEINIKIIEK